MHPEVYIFAQMKVKDYSDYFSQYGAPFMDIIKKFEGKVLAATKNGKVLEGAPFGNWTVLLKFPSKEKAYGFISSEEYAPLIDLRVNELTQGGRSYIFPSEIAEISEAKHN
ncbi:MAG: DUF1330 domain-containing protein [Bacteroidota bacterium]